MKLDWHHFIFISSGSSYGSLFDFLFNVGRTKSLSPIKYPSGKVYSFRIKIEYDFTHFCAGSILAMNCPPKITSLSNIPTVPSRESSTVVIQFAKPIPLAQLLDNDVIAYNDVPPTT